MKSQTQVYSCFPKKDKQVVFCLLHNPMQGMEPIHALSVSVGDAHINIHAYGKEGLQSVANALQGLTNSVFEQLKDYADNENNVKVS